MIRVSRTSVSLIGVLFGLYNSGLGAFWVSSYQQPIVGILAIAVYSVAIIASLLLYRGLRMPMFQAFANLALAAGLPLVLNSIIEGVVNNTFATWYIGGLGVLLATTAVRGHRTIAWVASAIVVAEVVAWGGATAIIESGIVGMVLMVAAGQAISLGLERASIEARELAELASADAAATAATSMQRLERKLRAQLALESALPILQRIVAAGGNLSDAERVEARLSEAALRDEIRGRELINDRVREAVRLARVRGVEVVMLDEGGLDGLETEQKTTILNDVAAALDGLNFGKATVRAPANEAWKVTVAAMVAGSTQPLIWLKLS
jgi:hypothetical protein